MIKYNKVKLTPNEYAKKLVLDKVDNADYWRDYLDDELKAMSEKEIEAINNAINKQQQRVYKFLNAVKLWDKIFK